VIAGAFQTAAVFDAILTRANLPQNVDLYLYPAQSVPDAMPVYVRGAASREQPLEGQTKKALAGNPSMTTTLRAGDAKWELVIVPEPSGLSSYYRAWLVLAAVLLVFSALLAYMWASMRHALRLEAANSRVLKLAQTDLLTSLANRRAFLKRLTMAFAGSLCGAPPFAVLYLDIDNFKDVNDTLGHAMGDLLLKEVVRRLRSAVRTEDLVARFGGDEFAILMPHVTDPETAGELAARIGKLLAVPFSIKGHKVRITSSIGIALLSPETASPEAMMMQADLALYDAKDEGRDCYRFHSHDLDREVHERVRIGEELRVALDHGELALLPAASRACHRPHHRARSVDQVEPRDARLAHARYLHSHRRTDRSRAADRPLGIRGGVQPAQAVADRRHCAAGAVGQCVGRSVQRRLRTRARNRGEFDAMGHRPLPS
jgi:diguanylate cyclase